MDIEVISKNIKAISDLIDKMDTKEIKNIQSVQNNEDKFLDIPLMELSQKYPIIPSLSEPKRGL